MGVSSSRDATGFASMTRFIAAMFLLYIICTLSENVFAYNSRASSCDAEFNSDTTKEGIFSSPLYPKSYPLRSHCKYEFIGRGKERVQINFIDFNLPQASDTRECDTSDSLNAYVIIEGRSEKIDSFCGNTLPKPLMSNGPKLTLQFSGQLSSSLPQGFKATYSFVENFGITVGRQLPDLPCAFTFNSSDSSNGTFNSPNFPGLYPRNTECHYFFYAKPKEKVHLNFLYFDVEGVSPCESISASDYVEFSNFNTTDRKYSRHCGQLKGFLIESDRRFFRVTFRSNDRLDGTGFRATYQFLNEVELYTRPPADSVNNHNNIHANSAADNTVGGPAIPILLYLLFALQC